MHLAILNPVREYGGGEKWALRTARALQERGHQVTLCCHPDAALLAYARKAGVPTAAALLRHDVSLPSVWRLAGLWRRLRPDVVLACTERAARLAAWSQILTPGLRLVYRNGLQGSFKNKTYNRLITPRLSRIVTNAQSTHAELLAYGWIPAEKLAIIHNGVEIPVPDSQAVSAIRAEFAGPDDALLLLAVGRLVDDKGHRELLQALSALRDHPRNWRLLIAGEGPRAAELQAEINHLHLGSRVTLVGFRDDIDSLYAAADLLVHPSLREGAPNAVLEAMAAGCPVLATDVAGTRELLGGGSELLSPGDVSGLSEAIAALIGDADRRRALAVGARKRVAAKFSLDASVDRWESLFQEVSAGASAPLSTAGRQPESLTP